MEVSGTSGNEEEMAEEAEGEVPRDCRGGAMPALGGLFQHFWVSGLEGFRLHWVIALLLRLSGGWLFWRGHAKEELQTWPSPSRWVGELWGLPQVWSSEAEGLSQLFPPCSPFKGAFTSLSALPKKGNNLKVTIFSYLSLRKHGSEFGENVHNFPTIAPFDFCQSNLIT